MTEPPRDPLAATLDALLNAPPDDTEQDEPPPALNSDGLESALRRKLNIPTDPSSHPQLKE